MRDDLSGAGYLICSVASLLYIISPIDLIPDIIPVIGYLDDILVGIAGARALLKAVF